jgi:hypothetical protein
MKKLLVLMTVSIVVLGTSCKKKGCTDSSAVNYSTEAKKDDASCTYESTFSVWWGEAGSTFLVNDNATTLYLHVDGALKGSAATNVFMTGGNFDCGAGLIESTFDLGLNTSKIISYVIKDQTDFTYSSGSYTLDANCNKLELVF